jgi:hypothetical protein
MRGEVDSGMREGITTSEAQRVKDLERLNERAFRKPAAVQKVNRADGRSCANKAKHCTSI